MSKELEIIQTIFSRVKQPASNVVLGIGDDAALTRFPEGCELVTATDTLVAGTHFLIEESAKSVGHRCLAVNLSDIAAMAAEPLWASLALSLPRADMDWLNDFAEGFFGLADSFGVELIGGDTVRGNLSAAVTVQGCVARGKAIRRSGAAPGDRIFVTGVPGEAALGRQLAAGPSQSKRGSVEQQTGLIKKFYYPQPRVREARKLQGIASAMIDLSDGLHVDLHRLLLASNCGAQLDIDGIPQSSHVSGWLDVDQWREWSLCGGEDFELCFTVPSGQLDALLRVTEAWGCPVTCIGEVAAGSGLSWHRDGDIWPVPDSGFEHFD